MRYVDAIWQGLGVAVVDVLLFLAAVAILCYASRLIRACARSWRKAKRDLEAIQEEFKRPAPADTPGPGAAPAPGKPCPPVGASAEPPLRAPAPGPRKAKEYYRAPPHADLYGRLLMTSHFYDSSIIKVADHLRGRTTIWLPPVDDEDIEGLLAEEGSP